MTDRQDIDTSELESIAEDFSRQSNAILVLKGQNTIIAAPDGSIFRNELGSRALGNAFPIHSLMHRVLMKVLFHFGVQVLLAVVIC